MQEDLKGGEEAPEGEKGKRIQSKMKAEFKKKDEDHLAQGKSYERLKGVVGLGEWIAEKRQIKGRKVFPSGTLT